MAELILEGSPTISEIFAVKNISFITDQHDYSPAPDQKYMVIFPDERTDYLDGYRDGFYAHEGESQHLIINPQKIFEFLDLLKLFTKMLNELSDTEQLKDLIPFAELMNFVSRSNRFGTFGPITAKKVADEFNFYKEEFLSFIEQSQVNQEQEDCRTIYLRLLEIFEYAGEAGLVMFT